MFFPVFYKTVVVFIDVYLRFSMFYYVMCLFVIALPNGKLSELHSFTVFVCSCVRMVLSCFRILLDMS